MVAPTFAPLRPTPLQEAIAKVARSAPRDLYEDFINQLQRYASEVALEVTTASADKIFIAQGRSQQTQWLLRLFQEVDERPRP